MTFQEQAAQFIKRIREVGTAGYTAKALDDVEYSIVLAYCDAATELNAAGRFNPAMKLVLATQKWNQFNFRYGIDSLKGFLHEIVYVVRWNNENDNEERARLVPENRETQIDGVDAIVSKPSWSRDYTVQVKSMETRDDAFFTFHKDWVRYDVNKVDRLALVDQSSNIMISLDYRAIVAYTCWKLYDEERCFMDILDLHERDVKLKTKLLM